MAEQTPDNNPAPATSRACRVCHAPLEESQEWCLACGAATSDRKHRMPGKRAAATVAALTLALTGGAVAAAYAALSSPPGAPIQLAQAVPPGGTPDTVPAPTTTPAQTTPVVPVVPSLTSPNVPPQPKVTGPSQIPIIPSPSPSPVPAPAIPPPAPTTTTSTTPTTTTKLPAPAPQATALKLQAADFGTYDPDSRIVSPDSNRNNLFDKNDKTAWTASAEEGQTLLGFGATVDFQEADLLKSVTLNGKSGGIEIYGTTAAELPTSVTDPAWKKLGSIDTLDGQKTIELETKKKKYDMILLWFTTAPPSGPTVSLGSLGVTALR